MEQAAEKTYPEGYRPMTKEEFVRRMLSDVHKRILKEKEKERRSNSVVMEYKADNINRYKHKMHLQTRRGR